MALVAPPLLFLQTLNARRAGQVEDEARSATSIQAAFRGFTIRPQNDRVLSLKDDRRAARMNGESSVEAAMLKGLDVQLGLEPIPGVTLPKAGKAGKKARLREKRKKEKEAKGAVALQNVARIRNARQEVAAKRKQKEDQDQDQAAGVLGRVMRGKMGRKKFNEKKEGESITLIQGRFRMLQSKKRVDALKYERKVKEMAAPEDEEDEDFEEAVRQELLSGGEF